MQKFAEIMQQTWLRSTSSQKDIYFTQRILKMFHALYVISVTFKEKKILWSQFCIARKKKKKKKEKLSQKWKTCCIAVECKDSSLAASKQCFSNKCLRVQTVFFKKKYSTQQVLLKTFFMSYFMRNVTGLSFFLPYLKFYVIATRYLNVCIYMHISVTNEEGVKFLQTVVSYFPDL